ncbi:MULTISPECIES: low temperature requirement protein A [Micromonospora]|uniref:Low temperature requirement protein A n=1 Tax=Micromonospora tulbaghiae TaxID=479978 RepID=A0A386WG01_9ACTN|nr:MULTISPECIES: low temperature requirement protein A [Micromonospora]AYF26618.1 low temperature requirement protein A [Micromonospora tulbaghiae]MBF5033539.1 low temperature requirement protein A [Micromonospora sp. ANENR4]RLP97601.1 low temperature requirement protein A [Micromonospora sp. BL1]WBC01139.1 low temperature requirement protein A [Micromonospora sp. WMMA1976]
MRTAEPAALRSSGGGPDRATFLELFFDLVYVFALTRISARAFEDLVLEGGQTGWTAVTGGGKTLLLLLALWAVWQGTAWTTSRYDPHHLWLQVIVITALISAMVMGVAIPRAFSHSGLMFAAAYVVAQVSRPAILVLVLHRQQYRRLKLRMLITFCATGVLWLAGALLPGSARVVLWTTALLLEYLAARFGWPMPGLGRSTVSRWDIHGEHLAERYQQIFLVALGETILLAGLAFTRSPTSPGMVAAFAVALATSVLLWRIYVQRAGQILGEAVTRAAHPATVGRSAADTHLVMVIGVVATAIGYELVIEHPAGHNELPWLAMILGGPAVFLAGRARFEYEVFGRVSPSRLVGIAALLLPAPLLVRLAPLVAAILAALVLTAVAVADARRAWGRPPEEAATPF